MITHPNCGNSVWEYCAIRSFCYKLTSICFKYSIFFVKYHSLPWFGIVQVQCLLQPPSTITMIGGTPWWYLPFEIAFLCSTSFLHWIHRKSPPPLSNPHFNSHKVLTCEGRYDKYRHWFFRWCMFFPVAICPQIAAKLKLWPGYLGVHHPHIVGR